MWVKNGWATGIYEIDSIATGFHRYSLYDERRRDMSDTPTQIQQRYKEMLMSRTPTERLRMVSRMYDSGRKLVIAGIQNGKQHLNASQLRGQLFLRMYGNDFSAADIKKIINKIPDMQLDVVT